MYFIVGSDCSFKIAGLAMDTNFGVRIRLYPRVSGYYPYPWPSLQN